MKRVRQVILGFFLLASFAISTSAQNFKFPAANSTTQPGTFPIKIVAQTGALADGTYSVVAKTSLQNIGDAQERNGECQLVQLNPDGTVASVGAPLDDAFLNMNMRGVGSDMQTVSLSSIVVINGTPNIIGLHCFAKGQAQFQNTTITVNNLQGIQGVAGLTPQIAIGHVTLGAPGSTPVVILDDTSTVANPVFDFVIPQGLQGVAGVGVQGPAGAVGPQGQQGIAGPQGPAGPAGQNAQPSFAGAWNPNTSYTAGQMVLYCPNGATGAMNLYLNVSGQDPAGVNPEADTTNWYRVTGTGGTSSVNDASANSTPPPPPAPKQGPVISGSYSIMGTFSAPGAPTTTMNGTWTVDSNGNITGAIGNCSVTGLVLSNPNPASQNYVLMEPGNGCSFGGSYFGQLTLSNITLNQTGFVWSISAISGPGSTVLCCSDGTIGIVATLQ